MTEHGEKPPEPEVPGPPQLPEVDSPDADQVLDGVPSTEEVVEQAESAEDVLAHEPTVDEILGREHRDE
jgi:hypothetical protein